ncbi:hypothetical protein ACRAWD_31100 [Caulobacter segnis]
MLVAESNAPPKKEPPHGIKGFFEKMLMKKAGAGVPSANRITLLRDADHDGIAEPKTPFLTNLYSPFGMALVGDTLSRRQRRRHRRLPLCRRRDADHRARPQDHRPAGRADQPPLDQEHPRQPRRDQALRHGRLQQQCRRERPRERDRPRRDPRGRPGHGRQARLRLGPAQSQRPGLEPRRRRAVDRGQRARRAGR